MKNEIKQLEEKLSILSRKVGEINGEYNYMKKTYIDSSNKIEKYKNDLDIYQRAVELLQLVSGVTREKVVKQFEDLVTTGLQFVFGEGYYFKLEFDRRGNLSTLNFKIITPEHDEACDPLDTQSGGILDLVSLILRLVIMETNSPKINGMIILDESLSKLDKDRLPLAAEFIKQLSDRLERQVIFISHSDYIINSNFNQMEIK